MPEAPNLPADKSSNIALAAPQLIWLEALFVALGIALRLLRFGLNPPLWFDEASLALNFAERDYRGLLCELSNYQVAPGLFLWIEKAVYQWTGWSEISLRLIPLLAGIGGVLVFWRLARFCLPPWASVLATGLVAVSQAPIELASTVKPYSIDLFLAALLQLLALHALQEPKRWWSFAILTLLVPFAVVSSYPIVFVAGAISLVLARPVMREGNSLTRILFAAFNLLLITVFIGHLQLVGREKFPGNPPDLAGFMAEFWHWGFPKGGFLRSLGWGLKVHVGALLSYPVEFNGGGLIGFILAGTGTLVLFRQGRRTLVGLCLLPMALHLLAACLHRYPYGQHQRLEQHLVPGICILIGAGLAALNERLAAVVGRRKLLFMGNAASLLLVGVGVAVAEWRRPQHDEFSLAARTIVQHLHDRMLPQDRVLICGPSRNCHVCLRWQLLTMAAQIIDVDEASPSSFREGSVGRLWILKEQEDRAPADGPEPPVDFPADAREFLGRSAGWQPVEHKRFRAYFDNSPQTYRLFCDIYLCESR